MALQVWLPLTKDVKNYGILSTSVNNVNATYSTSGKLGGCYSFNSTYMTILNLPTFTNISIAFWMKPSNTSLAGCLLNYRTGTGQDLGIFLVGGCIRFDAGSLLTTFTYTYTTDWQHVCVTYNGSKKILYINGAKQLEVSCTTAISCTATKGTIGLSSANSTTGSGNPYVGLLNDYRIYDNCLTADEIKEISLGKVLHLPMDDVFHKELLVNDTANWTGTTSTEHPDGSTVSMVGNNCWYDKPIHIFQDHSYTLSMYVKYNSNTTNAYIYPSIQSFDIDGKSITNVHCPDGFLTSSYTTLAQDLNTNDTVVYCTDLSNWTTSTTSHAYFISIFGYYNSIGNIYDNYTQYTLPFGSYSDKSNINKTANTVTLLSKYTGIKIPAGTKVCLTTAGSSWYYPFGAISQANFTTWTLKTATFTPLNVNRLRYANTIKVGCINGGYISNISLVDNTINKVYDISGNQNDATASGVNTISSDTPRYNRSLFLNGATVDTSSNTAVGCQYIWAPLTLKSATAITFSWWMKRIKYGRGGIIRTCGSTAVNTQDYNTTILANWDGYLRLRTTSSYFDIGNSNLDVDGWHHHVITYDGTTAVYYKDGVLTKSLALTGTLPDISAFGMGLGYAGGVYRQVQEYVSDVRIYATALSQAEVTKLYKLGR